MIFQNRTDAGCQLARKLTAYANQPDVLILALPRGGVPVAYEVALMLNAPLDVFVVRKLGVPGHEELAMGAIASGGVRVLNDSVITSFNISQNDVDKAIANEQRELLRREHLYRDAKPFPELSQRTVILIDDGLATGATMYAAIKALRAQNPKQIVVAVPVAVPEVCERFQSLADEVVCAATPEPFYGVGRWYVDFSQTSDEEVRDLLSKTNHHTALPTS